MVTEKEPRINTDTLKVGDIISKWTFYSSSNQRQMFEQSIFELQRHIIVGFSDKAVLTVVIFMKECFGNPRNQRPGSSSFISKAAINAGPQWRMG